MTHPLNKWSLFGSDQEVQSIFHWKTVGAIGSSLASAHNDRNYARFASFAIRRSVTVRFALHPTQRHQRRIASRAMREPLGDYRRRGLNAAYTPPSPK